jgi:hypothetical protein
MDPWVPEGQWMTPGFVDHMVTLDPEDPDQDLMDLEGQEDHPKDSTGLPVDLMDHQVALMDHQVVLMDPLDHITDSMDQEGDHLQECVDHHQMKDHQEKMENLIGGCQLLKLMLPKMEPKKSNSQHQKR